MNFTEPCIHGGEASHSKRSLPLLPDYEQSSPFHLKISCTPNLSLTSSPLWEKVIEEKLKQNDLEKFKGVTVKTVEFLPVIIITVFSFLIFKK
jgi:hypothetical protein